MGELEKIYEKLREVIDPEIGFDVVSLGEIEEVKVRENKVYIKLLPTTPLCPYLPFLISQIEEKLKELGYKVEVDVELEKQWDISRVEPKVRKLLGLD